MLNSANFSMRLTGDDQQMLFEMARHYERTKGDVLRLLIRNAHKNLASGDVKGEQPVTGQDMHDLASPAGPLLDNVSLVEGSPP